MYPSRDVFRRFCFKEETTVPSRLGFHWGRRTVGTSVAGGYTEYGFTGTCHTHARDQHGRVIAGLLCLWHILLSVRYLRSPQGIACGLVPGSEVLSAPRPRGSPSRAGRPRQSRGCWAHPGGQGGAWADAFLTDSQEMQVPLDRGVLRSTCAIWILPSSGPR